MNNPGASFRKLERSQGNHGLLIPSAILFAMLVLAMAAIFCFTVDHVQAYGETTTGKYTLSNGDVIEFCTTNQCSGGGNQNTNTFASGSTIYVKVHTARVNAGTGYLYLYRSNVNAVPPTTGYSARNLVWTQVGSDYFSSVTIPARQSYPFRIYGQVINGGNQVTFQDEIKLSTQPARFINFYWTGPQNYPPNSADESYAFKSGATVYVMGYGAAANRNATYTTNSLKDIVTGGSTALTMVGYARVSTYYHRYTLVLPASGLTDGQWYSINSHLMSASSTLIYDMSRMILIDDSAPTASITSPTASSYVKGMVTVTGTADDAYSYYKYLLEYGAGPAPGSWTTINTQTNMPPIQSATLGSWNTTSLTDGQLYTLRLTVTDRAGNPGNQTVVLRQVYVDNNPPVISAVASSQINSNSATISWTTDEVADSQVRYGTSSGNYTNSTTLDPTMVTSHSQALLGLQPSTTYYYQVLSTDNGGNQSISAENSFVTANLTIIQPYPTLGKDTYFGTTQPTWNRGAEATLSAGDNAASGLGTVRGAIRFDLSGIPASATIKTANVSLYQMGQSDTNTQTLNAHYLTRDWAQGTGMGSATGDGATWLTYDGANNWTAAGGDFNGAASGSATAPNSTASWVDWDLTALTQAWVNTLVNNYGVIIKRSVENPVNDDSKSCYSSDYTTDASLRPKIVIEWFGNDTAPPAVGEVRAENVTRTAADIKWSTDEQANSQVEFGTTTSYGSTTALDPALMNQHTVPLTGLTEDTVYHYRVTSADNFGNVTISGDNVFQTAKLITIQPSPAEGQDTWLSSSDTTLNYGAATDIIVGNNSAASEARRGMLKFDLSEIPVGSIVNAATMSIYQHAQQDTSTPQLEVDYATRSWTEGTGNGTASNDGATWPKYEGVNNWSTAGGDFNSSSPPSANALNSIGGWVNFNVSGLTQNWVSGTITNNGAFIKKSVEGLVNDYKTFYSSDYTNDPTLRPKLVIEYVPAPGSMTLTVNETFNRDATAGGGSVGFGNVSPGTTYDVGEGAPPTYAVKLTVKSNTMWGIKVAATGDLEQINPLNAIDISDLKWKHDGEAPASYQDLVKSPSETVITSGQTATDDYPYIFDYRLAVPVLAVSGTYLASVVYTAFPS
jgi:hypothetical protein